MAAESSKRAQLDAETRRDDTGKEKLRAEVQKLRTDLAVGETNLANARERIVHVHKELVQRDDKLAALDKEVRALQDKLATKESEVSKSLASVLAAKEAAEARLQAVHNDNDATLRQMTSLSTTLQLLQTQMGEADSLAKENRTLRDRLQELERDTAGFEGKVEELRRSEKAARRAAVSLEAELKTMKEHGGGGGSGGSLAASVGAELGRLVAPPFPLSPFPLSPFPPRPFPLITRRPWQARHAGVPESSARIRPGGGDAGTRTKEC
jgi:chromosome segregation ATPase